MGEGRFEHVPGSDDLSGLVDLSDLAEPLVHLAELLAKLDTSAMYKDHPGVHSMNRALALFNRSYRSLLQVH